MKHAFLPLPAFFLMCVCFLPRAEAQQQYQQYQTPAERACDAADDLADKDDYAGAITQYNAALALDPKLVRAYCGRGVALEYSGGDDKAIADFNRALALDPKCAEAYSDRGDVKLDLKWDLDGALADYNSALAIDPKFADAYSGRADLKLFKGDMDGAIEDCNHAIDSDPTTANAYRDRGLARQYKGDLDNALADFDRAIELDPNSAAYYSSRGNARQTKGDATGAMADFDRAAAIEPKNPIPCVMRGIEKFRIGKWADALADFRQGCQFTSEQGGAGEYEAYYQDWARIYILLTRAQMGEGDAANRELADYLAKNARPAPGDWFSKLAGFYTGSVDEAGLVAAADVSYKIPDHDQACEAWYYIGMKKLIAGDKKGAAEDFHKCLATEKRGAVEYQMAQDELKAMGEKL